MGIEQFEKYFDKYGLENPDPTSKEYFTAIVNIAHNEYDIPFSKFSEQFGISIPTLERWTNGENVPHRAMRPVVLEWLVDNLDSF